MLGFRVWDKEYEKFRDCRDLYINENGKMILTSETIGRWHSVESGRFILSQSTGLLDMDCDQIFEKDILWVDKNGGRYVVNSIYELYKDYFSEDGELHNHEIGIIGNIYENPELLQPE